MSDEVGIVVIYRTIYAVQLLCIVKLVNQKAEVIYSWTTNDEY